MQIVQIVGDITSTEEVMFSPMFNRSSVRLSEGSMFFVIKSKEGPYSITGVGHGADPGFLAVSPQATIINPVVSCRYFPGHWSGEGCPPVGDCDIMPGKRFGTEMSVSGKKLTSRKDNVSEQ